LATCIITINCRNLKIDLRQENVKEKMKIHHRETRKVKDGGD